jgi:hypothetical protein
MRGYALALRDLMQCAPSEGVEPKAGAPRADTNVMTDEAARGFPDGIERVAPCF